MCRRREYEAVVRTIIAEEKGATVVTVRGADVAGSVSLPQPKETLRPGTVVRITVESGPR
jgi:hypothetical protein